VEGEPLYRETAQGRAVVAAEGSRIRIGADLVASAGLWLTGGDEGPGGRDAFRRFRGAASARAQAGLLRTPVVTDLMWLLWEALDKAARGAGLRLERMPAWPQGRKFAVLLSHDVDLWRKRTVRQLGKELARSVRAPRRLPKLARCFCCGPDPWSDLDGIADLEERRGMRSTFFLLPGRPDRVLDGVRIVNSYDARPERVRDTARRLVARGWEVGLHGSFDSFDSAEALAGESRDVAALAGQPVAGCRQHFLRFERPTTWRRQAEAGLRYDATLGYHDADGYRAGFSFPFRPFANEELPLLELPLVVADGALREHQGLDAEAAWQRLQGYLERTEADGAMLSLLWHNTHFCELDAPGYRGVYERALDWTQEHGGWGASAREIAEWWEQRSASLQRME
jgi:peptidoglycan/xylan/chitin deacetylase (PgdA/CDA1 family)